MEDTVRCLHQLKAQTHSNIRTIISDGGSRDGSVEQLRRIAASGDLGWVEVLTTEVELWWSGSMAVGVDRAMQLSTSNQDFILMMNNDTNFPPEYVACLMETSQRLGRAAVGGLIRDMETGAVLDAGEYVEWQPYAFPVKTVVQDAELLVTDVDVLPGRGSLVPIEVFRKVGNINARALPHYLADYEFFYRVKTAGIPLAVDYRAQIFSDTKISGLNFDTSVSCLSLGQWWNFTFSRRSLANIIDHATFIRLHAPQGRRIWLLAHLVSGNLRNIFARTRLGKILFGPWRLLARATSYALKSMLSFPALRAVRNGIRALIPSLQIPIEHLEQMGISSTEAESQMMGYLDKSSGNFCLSLKMFFRMRLGLFSMYDPRFKLAERLMLAAGKRR